MLLISIKLAHIKNYATPNIKKLNSKKLSSFCYAKTSLIGISSASTDADLLVFLLRIFDMLSAFVRIDRVKTLGSVAELVDAPDLKSVERFSSWGFKSPHSHYLIIYF